MNNALLVKEIAELKAENKSFCREISSLELDVDNLESDNDTLEDKISDLKYQLESGESVEGFLTDLRSWLERSISDRVNLTPLSIEGGESVYKRLNRVLWNDYHV